MNLPIFWRFRILIAQIYTYIFNKAAIVRRNISLPDYLNNWAKENNINVSKLQQKY